MHYVSYDSAMSPLVVASVGGGLGMAAVRTCRSRPPATAARSAPWTRSEDSPNYRTASEEKYTYIAQKKMANSSRM